MNRPYHSDPLSAAPEGQTGEDISGDFVAEEVQWLPGMSPAQEWNEDESRRALDELFSTARQYRTSQAYKDLLDFVSKFRFYSTFNAMLIHVQMRGAEFVAPPHRWWNVYRRRIKTSARPLVILQPMGPVMFVFDVSDTQPEPNAPPLPSAVANPFGVNAGKISGQLTQTIENAKRDGVEVIEQEAGSQSAGLIRRAGRGRVQEYVVRLKPEKEIVRLPVRYEVLLNSRHSPEEKYATLVHELGHLYCGHLGTPNDKWWPDRRGLGKVACEFEAESVCYLVCTRLGIGNPSAEYLAGYVEKNQDTPPMSPECVMKATGLIEQMARERLKPRKEQSH